MKTAARPNRRAGFTLVELLVVIAIIGVLVSLLLPAIQMAREAANRIDCANNMKQLGVSLQTFHDTNKGFPAGRIRADGVTWPVFLMPFMEQGNLYNQFDVNKTYAQQPVTAVQTAVKGYYCPSRRRPPSLSYNEPAGVSGAAGDYAGSAGSQLINGTSFVEVNGVFRTELINPDANGKIHKYTGYTLADVLDGTSNTFLVGEKTVYVGTFGDADNGDGCIYSGDHPATALRMGGPGFPLASGTFYPDGFQLSNGWGSFHPATVQFTYCDGSVHALSTSTDLAVVAALATRAGGEANTNAE